MLRKCKNTPDFFCYVCEKFTRNNEKCAIKDDLKVYYFSYSLQWLKIKPGNHMWYAQAMRKDFMVSPMISWFRLLFRLVILKEYSKKNKYEIIYPNLKSSMRCVPHDASLPIPIYSCETLTVESLLEDSKQKSED